MSSRFGEILRVSIFGESHGEAVGVLVEGLPAGEEIDIGRLEAFMARRTPGGELSTARREPDIPHIVSGLLNGRTPAPLCAVIENRDARPGDYSRLRDTPRPGHADYPALVRYGAFTDLRGGGHFSGRLTAPLCAAGAICLQLLERRGATVGAHIYSIGGAADAPLDPIAVTAEALAGIGKRSLPVLDAEAGERMRAEILAAARAGDSVGGTVSGCALGLPPGLGGPLFGAWKAAGRRFIRHPRRERH
jgi:chorismate synthase